MSHFTTTGSWFKIIIATHTFNNKNASKIPLLVAISLKGFSFQPFRVQLFEEGANNFRQNLNLYGNHLLLHHIDIYYSSKHVFYHFSWPWYWQFGFDLEFHFMSEVWHFTFVSKLSMPRYSKSDPDSSPVTTFNIKYISFYLNWIIFVTNFTSDRLNNCWPDTPVF